VKFLVVYAHPRADSYCHALKETVAATLRKGGHAVDVLDLYAEDFRAEMSAEERGAYHTEGANLAGIESHVARLKAADALVFVYPTWWYGLPAILKGWFDRVWAPGVVFEINGGVIRALLTNVRAIHVVSTMGAPWWFAWMMGHPGRLFLRLGVKRMCAKGCRFSWRAHDRIDSSTPDSRAAFLARVARDFARL
jgi:NAD(P)H dehydrogenase (quinone)